MVRKVCNMCGRDMDEVDEYENFSIHMSLGYGTKYDGAYLELDLCCHCMELLIEECEISPVTKRDGVW